MYYLFEVKICIKLKQIMDAVLFAMLEKKNHFLNFPFINISNYYLIEYLFPQ